VNQTNVGLIPAGGIVERDTAVDLSHFTKLSFLLRDPDFSTARSVADAINRNTGSPVARVIDSRRIDVVPPQNGDIPDFLATVENLQVMVNPPARVVIDERTGTVVVGNNVKLGPISIVHGDLAVEISTKYQVSQPGPFSGNNAQTVVVPQTTVNTQESPAAHLSLAAGSSVEQLVEGLQQLGATPRDIVGILQAIKASGALQAQLEVI
jgi:flagellar P-ring protein precursor FlgI